MSKIMGRAGGRNCGPLSVMRTPVNLTEAITAPRRSNIVFINHAAAPGAMRLRAIHLLTSRSRVTSPRYAFAGSLRGYSCAAVGHPRSPRDPAALNVRTDIDT